MKIVVGIATAGRRKVLAETIAYMTRQTRAPDALYICPASDDDLDPACLEGFPAETVVVRGNRGLPAQRNAIIDGATHADIIIFFDDDYLPEAHFIEGVERLFTEHPDVVIGTGHVLADGARGPGILYADGVAEIERHGPAPKTAKIIPTFGGYGCNMAIRMAPARQHNVRFDERLPLYAWWEDIDFSRRLAHTGRIVQDFRLRGVHLGSKSGRTPGKKLGYSQVANPIYMARKGSISFGVAFKQVGTNMIANLVKTLKPEPWVDRKGRLHGNLLAFRDFIFGGLDPAKILKL